MIDTRAGFIDLHLVNADNVGEHSFESSTFHDCMQHSRGAIGQNCKRVAGKSLQRFSDFGIRVQAEIGLHQLGTRAQLMEAYLRLGSEEHTSELQSLAYLGCRPLLEKKTAAPPRHTVWH